MAYIDLLVPVWEHALSPSAASFACGGVSYVPVHLLQPKGGPAVMTGGNVFRAGMFVKEGNIFKIVYTTQKTFS